MAMVLVHPAFGLGQLPGLLPWEAPVAPGADEARRWALEELAHKVYQDAKPGWAEQIGSLIQRALTDLFTNVAGPDGNVALAIAAGVVVLAIAAVIFVIRPRLNRRNAALAEVFDTAQLLSADQHRDVARSAAARGDFYTAVSEQFRAMVRASEERDVILPAVGRTAVEVAAGLERVFPAHARALLRSAELFNAVRYGDATPTAAMHSEVEATDRAVAASKPVRADDAEYADYAAATQLTGDHFRAQSQEAQR